MLGLLKLLWEILSNVADWHAKIQLNFTSLHTHDGEKSPMKRVGFVLKVKEDKLQEYVNHHEHVWPDMLDALRRNGWHNYSLFLRDDGLLFGYVETPEGLDPALAGMADEEANAGWQEFMSPYFEALGVNHPDQNMVELKEIFHLE